MVWCPQRIYSPKSRQFVMFQKLLVLQLLRNLMVENGSRKGKNFSTPAAHFRQELFYFLRLRIRSST